MCDERNTEEEHYAVTIVRGLAEERDALSKRAHEEGERVDDLITENTELRALVRLGREVVEDFMPNIGRCALQDYGRLNRFMREAAALDLRTEGTPNRTLRAPET